MPLGLRKLSQCLPRLNTAPPAPDNELGHVHPAASDLATVDPPLRFADPLRQFPLRQPGLFPHFAKERRDVPVNQGLVTLRRHARLIRIMAVDAL
jgi:hypothetical protein